MLKNKQINYQNLAFYIKDFYIKSHKSLCLVTKNSYESRYIYNELSLLLDKNSIKNFYENDILPYDHFSIPQNILKQRFKIINENQKDKHILITSVKNLFEIFPDKFFFNSKNIFSKGSKISTKDIISIVESLNYQKKDHVEKLNEYSLRGGIIDIFTPIYNNPLRIEIFDDTIESIRFFDIDSQLSIDTIEDFKLSKGSIFSLDEEKIKFFISSWRNYFENEDERHCSLFQQIKNNVLPEGIEIYYPFFFKKKSSFFELFRHYKYIKYEDLTNEINNYDKLINARFLDESSDITRPLIKPDDLFTETKKVKEFISKIKEINKKNIDVSFDSFNELKEAIFKNTFNNSKLVLMSSVSSEIEKLKVEFKDKANEITNLDNIKKDISIMFGDIVRPIFLPEKNIYIFHKEFLDKSTYNSYEVKENTQKKEGIFKLFNNEDYVVHEDYGIGIYKGLEVIQANKKISEYLKVLYANNEILYVPLRNISKISQYHKQSDIEIIIDSLSSNKWSVKKSRAKKRIADHAAEILDIESRRSNSNSTSLRIDDDLFNDFDKDFPYILTPDQEESINSIRKDLTLIKPMNRVLCGDVGFGKTEVAMRSAYISASSNKQVIIVTPSTILCDQHYNSFLKRFENFPFLVEKLSRFTTKKNKESIIKKFNENKIDILITTHIIFNSKINYKNTGLLVIDEEHKFGIKQKNFIKDQQANVHILYLSATPIPRTMNFVFSGLKDFSFLQTPPANRTSIKSFLKIQSSQLIKEALTREKIRGGQSFIVQNDINKMESLKKEIMTILPDFKVSTAHGKLSKKEIKNVINDFKSGEIDGLICTTIIEMGLDIPNANTMIIINSHNFGLPQLHQLRGRVGRSEKQGYCYFLIPTIEIPKLSRKRLDTIIKYSNLGDGFMIAQEDLEIRGAGEILGDKQSGHVDNIGMSLYLSMLKEAIESRKKISVDKINYEINFYDPAYINENYLPSPIERLKIYKKINEINSFDDLKKLSSNIKDRCGKIPKGTINLINNKMMNLRILGTGIKSIKSNETKTTFELTDKLKDSILSKFINMAALNNDIYEINSNNKFIYKLDEKDSNIRRKNVNLLLDELL